ncbi:hypothetical protein MBLNU13_g05739t1 [Cladosporium sp. NU13]
MAKQLNKDQKPVTPPKPIQGAQADENHNSPPPAPRHPNPGVVSVNGNVRGAEPSPLTYGYPYVPRSASYPLAPHPLWTGPPAVSGHLANPNDPFITGSLAGGAPAFVPTANNDQSGGPRSGSSSPPGGGPTDGDTSNGRSSGGRPSAGSSGNAMDGRSNSNSSNTNRQNSDPVIACSSRYAGSNTKQTLRPQTPNSPVTRFIRVDHIVAGDFEEGKPLGRVKGLQVFQDRAQKLGVVGMKEGDGGTQTMLLFIDTLSDAKGLYDQIKTSHQATFISCEEFRSAKIKIGDHIERLSSVVTFFVTLKEHIHSDRYNVAVVTEMAKSAAARFGPILRFDLLDDSDFAANSRLVFTVDYNSVADATDAVLITNPVDGLTLPNGTAQHIKFQAIGHEPVDPNSPAAQTSAPPRTPSPGHDGFRDDARFDYSPTGRTATHKDGKARAGTVAGYCRPGKLAGPYMRTQYARNIFQTADPMAEFPMLGPDGRPHPAIAKPQDVNESRIIGGYDVRTTLMVRNIPPEMTGADFIDLLQRTVPGQFDFAYNRIDFQKSQSVGYAFVNFVGTHALLTFVHTWRGRLLPHNLFRKHLRPCAVSYANTQGYECLVAKFRNSSILEEAKPCRPVLFWTVDSAKETPELIGKERDWPPVDNTSKKARSVENAKISGLYTPRARPSNGTHRGSGRRGGHARFDRGTPAQQQDDHQMGYVNYQYGNGSPAAMYGPYAQPRFQPQMLYDWQSGQFVPQHGMPYRPMPYQLPTPPLMPPPAPVLRTHTNGSLGYRHPVMPAEMAPVNSPTRAQTAHQDQFQPLLYPVKGQIPEYYRSV